MSGGQGGSGVSGAAEGPASQAAGTSGKGGSEASQLASLGSESDEERSSRRLVGHSRLLVPAKKPRHQPLVHYDLDSDDDAAATPLQGAAKGPREPGKASGKASGKGPGRGSGTAGGSGGRVRVPAASAASHALLKDGFEIDLDGVSGDESEEDLDLLPPRPAEQRAWPPALCSRSAFCLPDRSRRRHLSGPDQQPYTLCRLM